VDYRAYQMARVGSLLGAAGVPDEAKSLFAKNDPSGAPLAANDLPFKTTTTRSSLIVAGQMVPTYLVTFRASNAVWVKIWIGMQGQILKLDSPFGLSMLAEGLSHDVASKGRVRSRL
jgi:hypothetical protein